MELGKHLKPEIEVVELDTHLNTLEFARAAVDALDDLMPAKWPAMRRREVPIAPQ